MQSTLAMLALVLTASTGQAQESYTIKLKIDADVGRTMTFRSSLVSSGSIKVFDANNKLINERKPEGDEMAHRVTVLDRDKDGKPTKYVRVYEKATEKDDGKTKALSYQGRTALFEKVDGKFRVGVVGEPPLDAKDSDQLYEKANKKSQGEALLRNLSPGKAVKVGDSWTIPIKPLAEAMEDSIIDLEKSSATAKLVKAYTKGKSQFGTFEVAIKFTIKAEKDDDETVTFDPPGVMTMNTLLDIAIDGSTTERKEAGTASLTGKASGEKFGAKYRIEFDMKGKGGDEYSAEIDDPKARIVPKVTFAARPGEWIEFKQKDHAFQIRFPGSPVKDSNTSDRGITTTEYMVETDGRRIAYAVLVNDYPADKFKIDPATAYANLKKTKGLTETNDIKIAGLPGIELKQDVKKAATMHVTQRVVVVGQRMYQLMVVVQEGRTADAKQFFDSFRLEGK
jgi:hypothetical protein